LRFERRSDRSNEHFEFIETRMLALTLERR
jgi:hypothetical protein